MMRSGSSRKRHFNELLNLLSTERKDWWRSSPGLFDSEESESEYLGGTKKKEMLVPPTPTPKKKELNVSGTWPLASDSDWSESEGGEEDSSPPNTPPPPYTHLPPPPPQSNIPRHLLIYKKNTQSNKYTIHLTNNSQTDGNSN
ncbi:ORF3 [Pitorquevirus ursid8]|uniref:ORF3 n=1 Tax=Giant panda anellovirus TaxID=2016460 RepID=A0A220IGI0_9VIRU|nr:ORF3 [Giant panda anellovirus]ASH99087.1 ORF3 [Giant panda anellovirus]